MKLWTILLVGLIVSALTDNTFARGWLRRSSHTQQVTVPENEKIEDKTPVYEVEKVLLERINQERARYGLRALVLDPILHMRARIHCGWMARRFSMVHSNDGPENIAMGYASVEAAVNGWMNSSGHRANILGGYTRTGIAAYTAPNGSVYWCEQFN